MLVMGSVKKTKAITVQICILASYVVELVCRMVLLFS